MQKALPKLLPLLILLVCLSACAPGPNILTSGNWQSGGLEHQHIRALAVDPNNLSTIYAGDAQEGVFVSTDGGQHWTRRNTGLVLPNAIHVLSFDSSGKKLYAATDDGIFVSADAAQHWRAVDTTGGALPTDSYTALAFDLKAAHTIYVGTAHHGVLISTNDGETWSSANTGLPPDDAINGLTFDSDQHQLWAATASGIYRSDNGGATWRAFNSGLPSNIVINTVQPASTSGGARGLIFAGTNQGFFRSQDSGAHWAPSQVSLAGTNIRWILVDFRSTNAATVYAAISFNVLRSDDSGQSWGGVAPGLPGHPVYALALGASNYSQLYAATDGVYLFPGSTSGISFLIRLVYLIVTILIFYLLYRLIWRMRKPRRQVAASEDIVDSPMSPPSNTFASFRSRLRNRVQSNSAHPMSQREEVGSDGEEKDS